jgi:hypothetical protein
MPLFDVISARALETIHLCLNFERQFMTNDLLHLLYLLLDVTLSKCYSWHIPRVAVIGAASYLLGRRLMLCLVL